MGDSVYIIKRSAMLREYDMKDVCNEYIEIGQNTKFSERYHSEGNN